MESKGNINEIKLRLIVTNVSQDPDVLTKTLGITPSKIWRKGDAISAHQSRVHEENGWLLDAPGSPHAPMEKQLEAMLHIIEPRVEAFGKLPAGSEVELSCVVYEDEEDDRPCIEFSVKAVNLLARIGGLIYFPAHCRGVLLRCCSIW